MARKDFRHAIDVAGKSAPGLQAVADVKPWTQSIDTDVCKSSNEERVPILNNCSINDRKISPCLVRLSLNQELAGKRDVLEAN